MKFTNDNDYYGGLDMQVEKLRRRVKIAKDVNSKQSRKR